MYTLKLLLNIVNVITEAPAISGNKFLYANVKGICCELSQVLITSMNSSLLPKCFDPNQFFRYVYRW
jgi:hypothetical protein